MSDASKSAGTAQIIEREVVHDGFSRFERVKVRQRRRDGREQVVNREFQHRGDAVAVLPYDPDRRTGILVRQLRVPLVAREDGTEFLVEVPAGHLERGEDAAETARREAEEEAGLSLKDLDHIADVFPSPGMITEKLLLFLGRYSVEERTSDGGGLPHEGEDIEVLEWPLAKMAEAVRSGEIMDAKTVILIQALMLKKPELFGS
ncbi:NUDIX hydrolase [Rhizobiales bacterium]|uniref:NUDIX domain-containing protein n=1 Tax=Hongsoonwoonella zoysiae TaxID=2821844 RepID=UPI001560DF9E|nr:NUDIX hydrolase [Hongsoonwoonella zoysiae]NRG19943.1 NUDIX hydrolase [Hongsoonwoonella zoysiae]